MLQDLISYSRYESPIGQILSFYNDNILCHLDFTDCQDRWGKLLNRRFPNLLLEEISGLSDLDMRLDDYFSKSPTAFDDLAMDTGGTDFQKQVWAALCKVPFGAKETYSSMASIIGKPKAVRAMAAANALNPISIVIPCHRIVGKDGSLTGYGGGLERKKTLLLHEQL
ncbi:methylated-DNA--[protein]-cysteine S-methyltransferase [uncultured Kiloniella sp.]|uniref:methylated-DNA--[protein]-cysteine S-methyltransferase n=1 Tax=uncultured Kiloniella sp. TaxID=1133091 RepID=UPI002635727D|nr:methylated-DNA--[protein]-cysteine S-methyltransferase [uncultured Kiloniella sp.]